MHLIGKFLSKEFNILYGFLSVFRCYYIKKQSMDDQLSQLDAFDPEQSFGRFTSIHVPAKVEINILKRNNSVST